MSLNSAQCAMQKNEGSTTMNIRTREGRAFHLTVSMHAKNAMQGAEVQLNGETYAVKRGIFMIQTASEKSGEWLCVSMENWLERIGNAVAQHYQPQLDRGISWPQIWKSCFLTRDYGEFKFSMSRT